jgi:hypothetical protein
VITAEELVEMTESKEQSPFKLGTVVELFEIGTAKIQFDGEEEPSEKEYSYLASYKPSIGDRVLLASVAGTYVIMDKIKYQEAIEDTSTGNFESLTVENNTKTKTLDVTSTMYVGGTANLNGGVNVRSSARFNNGATVSNGMSVSGTADLSTLKVDRLEHNGTLGFFGGSPIRQKTVWTLMSSASLSDAVSRLNELLRALKAYGLIYTD